MEWSIYPRILKRKTAIKGLLNYQMNIIYTGRIIAVAHIQEETEYKILELLHFFHILDRMLCLQISEPNKLLPKSAVEVESKKQLRL